MQVVRPLLSRLGNLFQRPEMSRRSVLLSMALVAIFAAALIARVYPARYGYYLNEFDPYFDYYGASFIVDRYDAEGIVGFAEYFSWRDFKTWFPEGRDVAATSQVGLHFGGAVLYIIARDLFGIGSSLYDFLVLFPAVFGALTIIPIFLIVRRLVGPSGAILASLIIAFSTPLITRGNLGWFKSEPFALFLAISGSYLFLTLYDSKMNSRRFILTAVTSGFLLGYANTAWGGSLYFAVVFGLLLLFSPFLAVDHRRTVFGGTIFVSIYLLSSAMFPRPGPSIITNPAGFALLGGLGFALLSYVIRMTAPAREYSRTLTKVIIAAGLFGLVIVSFGFVSEISGRYLTVLYPYLRSGSPLVESVAEHFIPTGSQYFIAYIALIPLAAFGSWMLFKRRDINSAFALTIGITAIYIASSFSRLLVFSSIAFAILAAVGFAEITSSIIRPALILGGKRKSHVYQSRSDVKILYSIFMIGLIALPVITPGATNAISGVDFPVSIANASTGVRGERSDWFEALAWMRANTPPDAVIAAWWDYGYWITVMGNRTSVADNATINSTRIAALGRMFMSPEDEGVEALRSLKANYVLVFVVGQKVDQGQGEIFVLGGGGDESKKQWFIRIGGLNIDDFLETDEFTPKPFFWENTLLGKLWPFEPGSFIDQQGNLVAGQWEEGRTAVYSYSMKFLPDSGGPLRLAFASSSILEDAPQGIFTGVLIYEVVPVDEAIESSP
ncbi:MAG: STT3 domain-containing protein [Nitrososphaerales archaeon]